MSHFNLNMKYNNDFNLIINITENYIKNYYTGIFLKKKKLIPFNHGPCVVTSPDWAHGRPIIRRKNNYKLMSYW